MAVVDPKEIEVANLAAAQEPVKPDEGSEYDHSTLQLDEPAPTPAAAKPPETPAEPVKETAPVVEAPKPLPLPKHSRILVKAALEIDPSLTMEQINGATAEQLDEFIERNPIPKPKAEAPAKAEPVVDELDKLLDEGWEPRVINELKQARKDREEVAELKKSLKTREDNDRSREAQRVFETIDGAFDSLPEPYQKMLGTGGIDQLREANPAFAKRRAAVFQAAGIDQNKLPSPKVLAEKLKATATELFGIDDTPAAKAPPPPAPTDKNGRPRITSEQYENAALAVPTQRKLKEPKGDGAAIAAITQLQKEQGWHLTDDDAPELKTVPD